uniref:Uncharacterized protein n=1 Tax=Pararge aegeria TaxID=116150 RepID=S4PEV9_9NEOP
MIVDFHPYPQTTLKWRKTKHYALILSQFKENLFYFILQVDLLHLSLPSYTRTRTHAVHVISCCGYGC